MLKKKQLKSLLLFNLSFLLLASCSSNDDSSNEVSSNEETINPDYKDIYSFYSSMKNAHNFTIETDINDGKYSKTYSDYFTNTYVYCDYETDQKGFAIKNNKVFRFDGNEGNFISSDEYLKDDGSSYSSLWDTSLFATPILDVAYLGKAKGVTSFDISSKNLRLQYLSFLNIDSIYLTEIKSMSTYIEDNHALIKLSISSFEYTSTFYSIGSTSNDEVEDYLKNADAAIIDEYLLRAKEDFLTNNFTHVHRESLTYDENNSITGYEYFTPDYYYDYYLKNSGYSIYSKGYMSLHNKVYSYLDKEGNETSTDLDGAYLFYLDENAAKIKTIALSAPAFVTNIYDMPTIMDYPSNMDMWDHNLQYFTPIEDDSRFEGKGFATTDGLIMTSFYNNSQLANNLQSLGITSLSFTKLEMFINKTSSKSNDSVTFLFTIKANGVDYACQYDYINFSISNIEAVDEFYSTLTSKEAI
ncbi:MAG TPA: hypothetical protein DD377_03090 [Firmicutes bacterium]|nr:hypothetical protein [Bacillota bacterium]